MSRPDPKRGRPGPAPAPPSLVGVAPRTLARAHDLARGSGVTVSEWLDRLVADADAEASEAPARPRAGAPRPRALPPRISEPAHDARRGAPGLHGDEAGRLASALAEVAARLGNLERQDARRPKPEPAPTEGFGKAAAHICGSGANPGPQALQADERLRALRRRTEPVEWRRLPGSTHAEAELARLKARLLPTEALPTGRPASPPVAAPGGDTPLAQQLSRVEEGQRRTLTSLDALGSALVDLEQRVLETARASPPVRAAAPPTAAPAKPAETPPDGALDVIEAAVRGLSDEVAASERRSTATVGRMGEEVIRIALRLDGRVGEVERRSDARAAALAEDLARLAHGVEERLGRADRAQSQGLEGLGGKIADVAEQLAGRIADAERRNAQTVAEGLGGVGEQLRRSTEALSARYEQSAGELAERLRESEARTVRLVGEAAAPAEPIELTPLILGEADRKRAEAQPEVLAPLAAKAAALSKVAAPPQPAVSPSPAPSPPPFEATRAAALDRIRSVEVDAHHPAGSLRAAAARILEGDVPPPPLAPPPVITPPRARPAGSTRELIENARAAARTAAESRAPRKPQAATGQPESGGVLTLRGGLGLLRRRREGARG